MRKFRSYLSISALALLVAFSSCKKDTTEDPAAFDCSAQTFPTPNGTATISFLNYTNLVGDFIEIDAAANAVLSFAIQIDKGTGNRPQKLRVYQTDCVNYKGDVVSFPGQPYMQDNDTRVDLRNTDSQTRNLNYTVPTGFTTLYLNFEVDESGSAYTYKRVKLNISGSGVVSSYSGLTLGAQSNAAASRLSSATGQTYTACNAAQNIDYIDVTYLEVGSPTVAPYLSSNPQRFTSPFSLSNSNPTGCGDGDEASTTWSTAGGTNTYFKASNITTGQFDNATATTIDSISISSSNNQYVQISGASTVYAFLNAAGKKGLIRVNSAGYSPGSGSPNGSVSVDVKISN